MKTVICHFYNEEWLLPWWLKHHKHIFDHGIMIDYASTDRSCEIIREICPSWEIRPSRNKYFNGWDIDNEVMDIEKTLDGWRMALNVTEFLYGNTDHLDDDPTPRQYFISNNVFVDMENIEKGPIELSHDRPLHQQRYWGYHDTGKGDFFFWGRFNRSIHNHGNIKYTAGRHFLETTHSFEDLVIFYYGWADINEQHGLARKLQIAPKINENHGSIHKHSKKKFLEMYRTFQEASFDMRDQMSNILEHTRRITGQEWNNTQKRINMEKYTYKYSDTHLVYMKEQIWEAENNLDVYNDLSVFEFTQIEKYIGNPKTVLEVGSGLGRGSIFLNHLLKDDSIQYILADRTGYTENKGSYNPEEDEFYNDLELTEDFCKINGIKNIRTFDTEKDDWTTLPKADFIFSLCSFGMHVSISRYIDRLISVANPTSTMVFGVRDKGYNENSFKDLFNEVIFILKEDTPPFPHENWLILKNPIK